MENCIHQYQLKESKKQKAERGSIGLFPSKDWKRIDIYFCIYCLEEKIIIKQESWLGDMPDWW